ncbi:hypothetical protein [Streptomyces ehimensis]|uniref:Integral membrane protein n=1 Tax=Streptomyces ehimensis TaxID=68195 RepID=A0ABV9BUX7_9ACTN
MRREEMRQGNTPGQGGGRVPAAYALFGNHRTLILGVIGTLAGAVGTIGGISGGARVIDILGFAAIGMLGLALAVGYVVVAAQRPRPGRR